MSELDQFKQTYFLECAELLDVLEEQFTDIEGGDYEPEALHAVFRAIHSIKGGAGAFGFDGLVSFTHSFETMLDLARDGDLDLTPEIVALCLRANDIVSDMVSAAQSGETLDESFGEEVRKEIEAASGVEPEGEGVSEFDDLDFVPVMVPMDAPASDTVDSSASTAGLDDMADLLGEIETTEADGPTRWLINFRPHKSLFERANEPLLLFRELSELGEMAVEPIVDEIPDFFDLDPLVPFIAWTITLTTDQSRDAIEEVFEFVDGDCDLDIHREGEAVTPDAEEASDLSFEALAASVMDTGSAESSADAGGGDDAPDAMSFADMLSDVQGDPAPQEADSQPEIQPETQSENTREPAPPQAAASQGDPKPEPKAEKADKTAAKASATPAIQSVRVDLDKVDRVVNMVGELVITQAMLTEQIDDRLRDNYTDLVRGLEVLAQHSRSLQDSVMAIRAQPVKSVFARMPRLIRELSAQTGKKIRLEMHGETTEIDKTVIEQLSDPLTHMIRNSADHGIESPEARAEQGKPEEGTIMLSAEQAGGKIVIRVSDDGAGINRKRVYGLAVERGIIAEDAVLSDEDIDQLVFAPGFSTAESVSNISGRGVGMDVVRQNIQKLGGRVHVKSEPGRGSSVTLTLPLTLAVLDVMMVRVGEASYVLPLGSIVESIQMSDASVNTLPDGARVLQLRGEYIQVIDLASLFSFTSSVPESDQFLILCELEGNAKIGLVVDTILGQQQVVIKSLEENFARLDGIAGATILGDGRVALILDVTSLKSLHRARSGAEAA